MSCSVVAERAALHSAPSSRSFRDTSPVESPDSNSDIGLIRMRRTLPAPVWRVASSAGWAEPARMKSPRSAVASQA